MQSSFRGSTASSCSGFAASSCGGRGRRRAARDRGDRLARLSTKSPRRRGSTSPSSGGRTARCSSPRVRRGVEGWSDDPYELYDGMGEVAFDKPGIGGDDRFFVCAPMFHGGADVPIYAMLRAGGSVAIVQGFRTETFWDEVRRWGCTVAWIHSAMSIFLAKAPPQDDDGDNPLRLADARADVRGHARLREALRPRLFSVYGMTGSCRRSASWIPPTTECSGKPNPGFQVSLVDEHDYEVEVGVAGELLVRHSPWVLTPGYYNRPNESLWRNGWLHTGDVFVRDEHIGLVDRVKDSIRRRGEGDLVVRGRARDHRARCGRGGRRVRRPERDRGGRHGGGRPPEGGGARPRRASSSSATVSRTTHFRATSRFSASCPARRPCGSTRPSFAGAG